MAEESPEPKKIEEMTFEEALRELEQIVNRLENEPLSLDDSLALFERGQRLGSHCAQILDKAELKITRLVPDQSAGEMM